jgi:long-chain acyl-CoA synthetase
LSIKRNQYKIILRGLYSGLTETLGPSTVGYPDDMSLVGTVGVAATYTDLRLEEVPEMGYDPLGVPSRGEILIRGNTVFTGYYKNPELTNEVMVDGWFHTGEESHFNLNRRPR